MKPLLRGHLHQAMFFVVLGAGVPLIFNSRNHKEAVATSVYILCALLMFGISTIYHRVNWSPEKRLLWRKLDHAGIYLMIAGTFTPVAMLALNETSSIKLLSTIWGVAIVGVVQSIFFVNLPKILNAALYVIAGYLILPYLSELKDNMGMTNIWLILLGGLAYTIGAICYGLKKPVLSLKFFSYHEIFHFFVNIGAIVHFFVVNSLTH